MRQRATGPCVGMIIVVLVCGCTSTQTWNGGSPDSQRPTPATTSDEPAAAIECAPAPDMPQSRIAYTQIRDDGSTAIFLMKADGTDKQCLVDTAGPDTSPAWSPDGRWVAFQGGTAEQEDIFVVRADGTRLRQLTETAEWDAAVVTGRTAAGLCPLSRPG